MTKYIIAFSLLLFAGTVSFAQGCSDAGFCSLQYYQQLQNGKKPKNSFTTELAYNIGEEHTTIISPSILYSRKFGSNISWDNKLVASYISGAFGNIFNAGDLYSTASYATSQKKEKTFTILGGIKIPFTGSNDKIKGQPLPMTYQSSLGTYDLIAGASLVIKKTELNAALQLPLINNNKNSYFSQYSSVPGFQTTNKFERNADVLLRYGYRFNSTNQKWLFRPNVLAIYHLGKDSYENLFGKRTTIEGSDGLTLNLNLQIQYAISSTRAINLSLATPVVVRDIRPDGLTRSFVFAINYQFGW